MSPSFPLKSLHIHLYINIILYGFDDDSYWRSQVLLMLQDTYKISAVLQRSLPNVICYSFYYVLYASASTLLVLI